MMIWKSKIFSIRNKCIYYLRTNARSTTGLASNAFNNTATLNFMDKCKWNIIFILIVFQASKVEGVFSNVRVRLADKDDEEVTDDEMDDDVKTKKIWFLQI